MTAAIYTLDQIRDVMGSINPIKAMEDGFVAYSEGRVVVPPVGELIFDKPPGEAHIKYGYIRNDEFYVIKLASGFYQNLELGLPPGDGLMLLFRQKTGRLAAILLDEGYLTNVRTAAAGAVAAKYLAPRNPECIGVFGAGVQARMQVEFLSSLNACRELMVWGVNEEECRCYQSDMEHAGYQVQIASEPEEIGKACKLIIMATPAKEPLLYADQIRKGTHITAMGSDTPEKQELDAHILARADVVVADSLEQSKSRGEIYRATTAGVLDRSKVLELGNVVNGTTAGRTSEDQLTVADLTGVAVQDIQISVAVLKRLQEKAVKPVQGN
jgi:ornithine cyclodeaminase